MAQAEYIWCQLQETLGLKNPKTSFAFEVQLPLKLQLVLGSAQHFPGTAFPAHSRLPCHPLELISISSFHRWRETLKGNMGSCSSEYQPHWLDRTSRVLPSSPCIFPGSLARDALPSEQIPLCPVISNSSGFLSVSLGSICSGVADSGSFEKKNKCKIARKMCGPQRTQHLRGPGVALPSCLVSQELTGIIWRHLALPFVRSVRTFREYVNYE